MLNQIKEIMESQYNFSAVPVIYSLVFDSGFSALNRGNRYGSIVSATVPLRGYVKLREEEFFYCTGITAETDTTNILQSPKIKIIDDETGRSLVQVPQNKVSSQDADFFNVIGNLTPGRNTAGLSFTHPIDYWFEPFASIQVQALNSGVGGTRTLKIAFHGIAFTGRVV